MSLSALLSSKANAQVGKVLAERTARKAAAVGGKKLAASEAKNAAFALRDQLMPLTKKSAAAAANHDIVISVNGKVLKTISEKVPGVVVEREGNVVRTLLKDFPQAMQHNSYTCGVGSSQSVMGYFHIWKYQDAMGKLMGTTSKEGTNPKRIVEFLNKSAQENGRKLKATLHEGMTIADLKNHVDHGRPVIIDYQAYREKGVKYAKDWKDGHYSVVVGYDNTGKIYLMDPSAYLGQRGVLTESQLLNRWRDYEVEGGKRRNYLNMGIVVEGRHSTSPAVAPTP